MNFALPVSRNSLSLLAPPNHALVHSGAGPSTDSVLLKFRPCRATALISSAYHFLLPRDQIVYRDALARHILECRQGPDPNLTNEYL